MLRWILLCASALLVSAGLLSAQPAAIPLAAYNIDPAQVSVSGFSSGASMAHQLGVAHSSKFIGVGIFAGLTAYYTQTIKDMYYVGDDGTVAGRKSVLGALVLYISFVNLFMMLLNLMGNRR